MAIKGKGRTKPKGVTRPPRRDAVKVRPPWFGRRWAQALGAFVVGILVSIFAIWLTNGLRENAAREADEDAAATARAAVQTWDARLTRDVAAIATIGPDGVPLLLPDVAVAIDGLASRTDVDEGVLDDGQRALGDALRAIQGFDLTHTVRDQGLDVAEVNYVLNSRDKVVEALKLYREAIDVAAASSDASGDERERLGRIAADLRDRAVALYADGFEDLSQAKASVGIVQPPAVPGATGAPELP
jgi:hypothetical protein